ncbi:MAG: DUF4012 domain-containing protein [Microthrixaceae bacterium]
MTASTSHRRAVLSVALASGVAAMIVRAQPTGVMAVDLSAALLLGTSVALTSSRAARRGRVAASLLILVGASGVWLVLAAALVGASWSPRLRPLTRAAVGGLTTQVMLHLPGDSVPRNVLLAAAAIACLVVSTDAFATTFARSRLTRTSILAGSVLLVVIGGMVTMVLVARHDLVSGIARAKAGLADARAGESDDAADRFEAAAASFRSARDKLESWWLRPARIVPVVATHVRVVSDVSVAGADLADAAARSARTAQVQDIRFVDGRLDLARVRALAGPLADAEKALARAGDVVDRAGSESVVAPVARRIDDFQGQIHAAASDAATASAAVKVLPDLLGGGGVRNYFIAFGTPAETRELGGFMGAYGILRADRGKLSLATTGRVRDINRELRGRTLSDRSALPSHLLALAPERFWQNITGTADFPTVAEAARQMWTTPAPYPIDGVLYMDPQALAAFLELTGPIRVPDYDKALTAETAAAFLLREQYVAFPDDSRHEFLVDAARTVFKELTSRELPGPATIVDALAPVAHERRLLLHSFQRDEQKLFERLRLDGARPPVEGDFLSVRASNRGLSKIDAMMQRSIDYEVAVDPGRSTVSATLTVRIRNDAPARGLPFPVLGNHLGQPFGTNSTTVSVYTPLQLVDVLQDGRPVGRGASRAYDRFRYTALVDVPAGREVTIVFELAGDLDIRRGYHLEVVPQPLVNSDELTVRVRAAAGWRADGDGEGTSKLRETADFDVSFALRS